MINRNDKKFKQAIRCMAALLITATLFLVSCQGLSILDEIFPQADSQLSEGKPTPENNIEDEIIKTPPPETPVFFDLVLWVPPQFDPNGESAASLMLRERIKEFIVQNPQVNVDVRVKALSGPGGMMDSLSSAKAVAQGALPSLALLNRSDLVLAENYNLLFPVDELSSSVDESDWFAFAQSMVIFQGSAYGLPFAANALGLIYRDNLLADDQPSWDEVMKRLDALVFAAGDEEAIITMALYQSAGGKLNAQSGKLVLDADALEAVLRVYDKARRAGLIKKEILDYQNDDQAWEAFLAGNADGAVTWANHLFSADDNLRLALLPPLGENPFTYGTGWSWCLTEPDPLKREYAVMLAEFLSAPDFLAQWAPISGYLPVRPSSLSGFVEEELQATLSTMLMSAHLVPDREVLKIVSMPMKAAVSAVIAGENTPEASAQAAIRQLEEFEHQ
ncbi:MAG: extracellular solute-binding protein [Pelolinea sp.]|nr:extracellular solute-binding protein [Pelolinea sp.]